MKFSIDIVKEDHYIDFDKETRIFLIACFLRHNEIINHAKFMAMCKLALPEQAEKAGRNRGYHLAIDLGIIPEKKPDRWFKRTHRSSITGQWYDHESVTSIYTDTLKEVAGRCDKKDITLPELLKYTNLLLNKPRNYCVDYVQHAIVSPIFHNYMNNEYRRHKLSDLLDTEFASLNYRSMDDYETYGYCCEDCDGDISYYRQSQYEHGFLSNFKRQAEKIVCNALNACRQHYEGVKLTTSI